MSTTARLFLHSTIVAASIATAAAAVVMTTSAGSLNAKPTAPTSIEPSDNWLKGLKAKHKQFFDNPTPNGGIALVHVMNYYDTYNKAYSVKATDINAVLTFYGGTTLYALNDSAWAKYRLGEFLDAKDPSGNFATANPWRSAPVVLGLTIPGASIESLEKRGATLIVCNNALQIFAGILAQKRGLDAQAVYQDFKASIIPGIELVPGMVIAVEQAQRAGLTYHRQ